MNTKENDFVKHSSVGAINLFCCANMAQSTATETNEYHYRVTETLPSGEFYRIGTLSVGEIYRDYQFDRKVTKEEVLERHQRYNAASTIDVRYRGGYIRNAKN